VDRMLGKLTTWLRLLGYDVVSANDFELSAEEDNLLLNLAKEGKVLLTRDRTLRSKAEKRGVPICFIHSNMVMEQLEEVHSCCDIQLEPKVSRCTICNSLIRRTRAEDEDMLKKEDYVPDRLIDIVDFWVCDNCGQVYWKGSHWDNIRKRIEELKKRVGSKEKG
jgi:hypothetical protein